MMALSCSSSRIFWPPVLRRPAALIPTAAFHQSAVVLSESGLSYKGRRQGFRPWQRGFWIREGERAEAGALILRQVNLRFHPGEHVSHHMRNVFFAKNDNIIVSFTI